MQVRKQQAAEYLAKLHKNAEPNLVRAFLIVSPGAEEDEKEPIKLLEIVDGAVEAGIMPIYYPANEHFGVPYSSLIVELSPSEFARYPGNIIAFPGESWQLGKELSI